jgi:choline kinase
MPTDGKFKTTEAVIIAAGQGSRIAENITVSHKCLIPIGDKKLIEHIIDNLADSGIETVTVITGFSGAELQNEIGKASLPIPVAFFQNDGWERGNGTSVFAAHNVVRSPHFILTMADHWFTREITRHINHDHLTMPNILAVDSHVDNINDIDDATKVLMSAGNRIGGIDKKLTQYNAIDCGIFRFRTLDIFPALEHAFAKQDFSLSGGVRELIDSHKMFWSDIEGEFWQDIDTVSDLEAVTKKLEEYRKRKGS